MDNPALTNKDHVLQSSAPLSISSFCSTFPSDQAITEKIHRELARTSFKLPPIVNAPIRPPPGCNPFIPNVCYQGLGDTSKSHPGSESPVNLLGMSGTVKPHLGRSGTVKPHLGMSGTVKPHLGMSGTVKPHLGTSGTVKPHFGTDGTVKPPPPLVFTFRPDRLGKLASSASALLSNGLSFSALCTAHRGPSSLMDPCLLPHPAAALLDHLRNYGASVGPTTTSWSLHELDEALKRGPHQSTLGKEMFVRDEFADMVEAGHWLVLPYALVKYLPSLRLSPTGVVPQKERRDRIIVDYTYSGVNQDTTALAPDSLQFGHALTRYLEQLHRSDTRHGPVYMSKTDIADAFMQIWLDLHSIPTLAALLPLHDDETPLVALPLVLPMGWVHSPNHLCAVTETICDITNDRLQSDNINWDPHHLSPLADTPSALLPNTSAATNVPQVCSRGPLQRPCNFVEVYMDDFIMACQLPPFQRTASRNTLFHCIDTVLRPLATSDIEKRKEPNSTKKLLKGDASWSTVKIVLGWKIDTVRRTIELPEHRATQLLKILDIPRHQHRTSLRKWQSLIGELRSMALALPGSRGLFSQLQSVLTSTAPGHRLLLTPAVHDQLDDLRWLANDLASRPTRWGEIIDSDPAFLGTVDACGVGMGGVWLDAAARHPPILWRHPFTPEIVALLISADRPQGSITNSDLEQAALVYHPDVLLHYHDVRERTIAVLSDNTAAVSRELKGSTSVDSASAYLCRLSALHQRQYRYRLQPSYLPGPLNTMADILSRRWDLTNTQILQLFDSVYPQAHPWIFFHPTSDMSFSVTQALLMRPCPREFRPVDAPWQHPTPNAGTVSVNNTSWTPTCPLAPIQSRGSKSSLSEFATAGFRPVATLSDLAQWRMRSTRSHRHSPSWVGGTPVGLLGPTPPTPALPGCSEALQKPMPPLPE